MYTRTLLTSLQSEFMQDSEATVAHANVTVMTNEGRKLKCERADNEVDDRATQTEAAGYQGLAK